MKRKGITTICLMIILMASIFVVTVEATETTEDGPIEIYDWYDLDKVRSNLTADYVLMNNLDESTDGYDELVDTEKGWEPIGYASGFKGIFDGQEKEIKDLYISRAGVNPTAEYEDGLFRRLDGTIQNLGLIDVNVTGDEHVGGLVGWKRNGTVLNSYVTGTVSGTTDVGGLVGWTTKNGNIAHSYANVDVDGYGEVGGLVGENDDGIITNSYALGDVNGHEYVGGLVGDNDGRITNSYATGDATATGWYAGGLVGFEHGEKVSNTYATGGVSADEGVGGLLGFISCSSATNSYSTGEVNGNESVNGLIGNGKYSSVSNCFYDNETSGVNNDEYGTGKTTEEMKDIATFTDNITEGLDEPWDFVGNPNNDTNDDELWDLDENTNDGYPFLTQKEEEKEFQLSINTDGEGTVEVDGQEVENWTKEYVEDTDLTLEAFGEDGYEFDEWTETNETSEEITITMNEDMDITAVFEEVEDEDGDGEDDSIPGFTLLLVLVSIVAVAIYQRKITRR